MRPKHPAALPAESGNLALARAVLAIGKDSFAKTFLASLQPVAPVDHVMVFGFRPDARAECLANVGTIAIANDLGEAYASHFHAFDPNKEMIFDKQRRDRPVHLPFAEQRIYPRTYRRIFFENSGIVDKFATALWHEDKCFYVNFYRIARSGRFAAEELAKLEKTSAALIAAVVRHFELRGANAQPQLALGRRLEDLFGTTEPFAALSARERDVCIKILLGYTSEAIALDLGVSHSTVLTYRRRAYERLGIGSQNELFGRVLRSLLQSPESGSVWPLLSH
jgi:DNA-binding CsgD family transcriptional regulator